MPTVAIVHAGEDTLPARALAEKLRAIKLSPVLEKNAGDDMRNAVKDAAVTIALWSPNSVSQQALVDDVAFARGKSKVIHATMRNAETPPAFRSDKTVNLTGWKGDDEFVAWRELAKLVSSKAGVAAPPPPAPKPPSGFFQPGRPVEGGAAPAPRQQQARQAQQRPAQQSAPRAAPPPRSAPPPRAAVEKGEGGGGGRGLIIGIIAAVVLLGGGAGGYYFWQQSQNADATATAWESVNQDDATALRAFIDGNPGEFSDEAEAALAQLEQRSYERARATDTIEAFEGFLNDFPASEHAIAARGRIAELRSMPAAPEEVPTELPTTDPDLVPPGATTPAAPATGGPAQLTPPTENEPSEEPAPAPTN